MHTLRLRHSNEASAPPRRRRHFLPTLALILASVFATLGVTAVNASPAQAKPVPAAAWAPSGDTFWVNTPCRTSVRMFVKTDRAHPGTVTATFVPLRASRTCHFTVWAGWGTMGADQIRIPLTTGPRGGPAVTKTYRTGPGIIVLAFGHRPSLSAVTFYTLV